MVKSSILFLKPLKFPPSLQLKVKSVYYVSQPLVMQAAVFQHHMQNGPSQGSKASWWWR